MNRKWTKAEIAAAIDHTLLKATATSEQIRTLCAEAKEYTFKSVCVNPCWVPLCASELAGSGVLIATVVGFPLGANSTAIKVEEARRAVAEGAREIDMVINIGKAKAGDWNAVRDEIAAVVHASKPAIVKTIIETCYLTQDEKIAACRAAVAAGAAFVKTSTGFGTGGATIEDVRLMKETVGDAAQVKASGGIKTYEDAVAMLEAGATRIGASAGVTIMKEAEA
ncbi:Deoxyribose-phosphate aldolase [uncultured spirochete]|jgi:deoxyribose-phosphate aldolase|uniref:Deoxyribose-phosphate aldolase n=1 Tax=uncultured spirochete TaxID=156406 RepID=A0A3P3XM59_9SPIR|nr:deoxyribose-phosphate aldolase [Rectinema subterraneum]SLM15177.1 Deoxyribose-phosphate aldolase [uncultured spirochete]HBE46315.1 deoxyribose-phosphate aldolase [Spirochaetaceae bacterium]